MKGWKESVDRDDEMQIERLFRRALPVFLV
jgi:hypothetical protein